MEPRSIFLKINKVCFAEKQTSSVYVPKGRFVSLAQRSIDPSNLNIPSNKESDIETSCKFDNTHFTPTDNNDGCHGFSCRKVYMDSVGRRMARCKTHKCNLTSYIESRGIPIKLAKGGQQPNKQWTLIPHSSGKCLLKADNNMYASLCVGCWENAVPKYNDFGVFLSSNDSNNAASLWEMEEIDGANEYTFKQVINQTDQYLSSCNSCAGRNTPSYTVFAHHSADVGDAQKWTITNVNNRISTSKNNKFYKRK